MKVREFELDNIHIEFYDDCCVSKKCSDELYKQLGKYIKYVKTDIQMDDIQKCTRIIDC